MKNQVIVITGASSGIGATLASLAAAQGARVVLVARRSDALHEVAKACGPQALGIVADVTQRSQVESVLAQAVARFGHVDVWVNNVGRGISRMPSELTDADLDEMMQVNVKSALYGMQVAVAHFKTRGSGQVINVSSMLGRIPFATMRSAYSASKHFLNALTATFRVEVHQTHPDIQISLFSPGLVATEFGLNALHGGVDSRQLPSAQPVEAVARCLIELIASRKPELYSMPGFQQQVVDYFAAADLTDIEKRPPFTAVRP